MKQKLTVSQVIYASFMLFSIFFGAGNMIFPPLLGQQAGTQAPTALLGFIITDAGLAVLGIIAVVIAGNSMDSLVGKAGKKDWTCFDGGSLSAAWSAVCAAAYRGGLL